MTPALPVLTAFVLTAASALAQPSTNAPDFVTVLQRNLKSWDKDKNNQLSPMEIDAALADPNLSGEDAAAAATIKCISRDNFYRVRRVDIATIKDDIRLMQPENRSAVMSDEWFTPDWQKAFEVVLKRAAAFRSTGIAANPTPSLDTLKIDRYGSIPLLAVLVSTMYHRPEFAQSMVAAAPDKHWKVITPLWTQELGPITEGQATSCSTSDDAWARVVESGIDALDRERFPQPAYTGRVANFDERFACIQNYFMLVTGKQSAVTTFRKPTGSRSTSGWSYQLLGNPEGLASTASQMLGQAFSKKKIAVALTDNSSLLAANAKRSVTSGTLPPNIAPFAAFAIVSIDPQAKTITLAGPGGGDLAASGPESISNGYAMTGGKWTMPLTDFVQVFCGFVLESDNPAFLPGQSRQKR
ncbi:MAG: hypothetical protein ACREJD_17400 [Phycisphaerales bacterium]